MEVFIAYSFIGLSAVLCILGLLSGRRMWRLKDNGLRIARDILPLALVSMDVWNRIPASLLAADLLFCDAVLLQSVTIPQPKSRFPFMASILSSMCLVRSVLGVCGVSLPVDASTFTALLTAFLLAAGPFGEWLMRSRSRREAFTGAGRISPQGAACSRVLALSCTVVVALGTVDASFSRWVLLALSLTLSILYALLYLQPSHGSRLLHIPEVFSSHRPETGSMDEEQRMDLLFQRIETYMQREQPFLDEGFTLAALAMEMLTNKGMVSKTINLKSSRNFCQYVNSYRIQYAVSLMKQDHRLRVVELSLMSGFHSVASFNMAFKLFMNDTPSEYMRTLQAMELLHPGGSDDG